ncbi:MAG TPA: hypothetical protein VHY35_08005 [Stellaceae bacterium]|jgi:uncharacterized membrane protein YccC|nr:hypothetical protein [Stellaceae bacterium]
MTAMPAARLKRSQASLFGGIVCGIGVMILYLLLVGDVSVGNLAVGAAIGLALGGWVRLADL